MDRELEKWQRLSFRVYEQRLSNLFREIESQKLDPILIKGWAAAQMYPEPWRRDPGDIDLVFHPGEFDRAHSVFSARRDPELDLHNGIRHLDSLDIDMLFANSSHFKLDGVKIRVLCPEDHLRVLCTHWLTDGGLRKERLWDIYYAVANASAGFDWDLCLGVVPEHRRRWVICTIGVANRLLALDLEGLPFEKEALETPEWLIREIQRGWARNIPLIPIHHVLRDPKEFRKQLGMRIPPNPIAATIGMEGDLLAGTTFWYRLAYIFKQAVPSLRRIIRTLSRRNG